LIYLSNFRTAGNDDRAISIAAITPRWYKGEVRKDLAPKLSTLTSFKKGKITNVQYIYEYCKVIYSHNLDDLVKELDNHVLLCYCGKNDICHRLLLGLYLKIETGVEVEEIGGFGEAFIEAFEKNGAPMRILLEEKDKDQYKLHKKYEDDNIVGHWRELKAIGAEKLFIDFK
jgi:hypothetical protein